MAQLLQASDFATEGERRAAEVLRTLPESWIVLANKILPASQGRSFEIDFIVIGDRTVFAIDEKSWAGRIHGSDQVWVRHDGSSEQSPLNKIDYVARILASKLRDRVPFNPAMLTHFVEGRVLLTSAEVPPSLRDPRATSAVLLLQEVVASLIRQDTITGDSQIGLRRQAIVRVLYDLSDRPKIPRAIDLYQIEEAIPAPYGSYTCRATHPEAGKRVLSLYNVAGANEETREFYLREFRALKQLSTTGSAPVVLDPFRWSEDYLVVPACPPDGVSLKALPRATGAHAAVRELRLAAAAFDTLARVHGAGVIHRALGPESVYVREADTPSVTFTNFFAARAGSDTISPKLDELHMTDPYAAPEIAVGYGFADASSDTYALALIFLERLSGISVKQLVHVTGNSQIIAVPKEDAPWVGLPPAHLIELITFFERSLSEGTMAPSASARAARPSAQQCAGALLSLASLMQRDEQSIEGQELDGRYTIRRLLGTGSSARTFLVTDKEVEGLFVIKQFLHPELLRESGEARREFTALRDLHSEHLPRVFDIYPSNQDAHVKMEYVEGVCLTNELHTYLGRTDRWRRLAEDLLNAVRQLESYHVLHRDIKPSNVIIRDGSEKAVLIDFGYATSVGTVNPPAGTPRYLPPEAFAADQPPPSIDRYALGVLLFDALLGYPPFREQGGLLEQAQLVSLDRVPAELRPVAAALLRAVHPDPSERYLSAEAFAKDVFAAMESRNDVEEAPADAALPELINPWVAGVRGLFRNSSRGNADNRGMDSPFAQRTYVETALDTWLWPSILRERPRVVFLSGNPGDGKTAFLERVRESLRVSGAQPLSSTQDRSGWVEQLNGHTFRACFDASEAYKGRSADEQVRSYLRDLEGSEPARSSLTVLLAINDGRLAEVVERFEDHFPWLVRGLDVAQKSGTARVPGGIWVIDLKHRAYVSLPDAPAPSVVRRLLTALTAPDDWAFCLGCAAQHQCPIRRTALALGNVEAENPTHRLEYALLLAHLRGGRHLTVRDIRSGLAYLLTGDKGCEDIHEARRNNSPLQADYWERAFGTDSDRDIMLGELQPLDPARFALPRLERFLYFHQSILDAPTRAQLFADGRDMPPLAATETWLERFKRRLYFESKPDSRDTTLPNVEWASLLPYQHAECFLAVLTGREAAAGVLGRIARGIGRSDGITGPALDHALCIKVARSLGGQMTVLKRFPLQEFSLDVPQPPSGDGMELLPTALVLRHQPSQARLRITLDLFELLLRLAEGLEPTSPELQALLDDLIPFKSRVQLNNSRDLVLVEGGQMQSLVQRAGQIICEPLVKKVTT